MPTLLKNHFKFTKKFKLTVCCKNVDNLLPITILFTT